MKYFKIVRRTPEGFCSPFTYVVDPEYVLFYGLNKTTKTIPGTLGIFAYDENHIPELIVNVNGVGPVKLANKIFAVLVGEGKIYNVPEKDYFFGLGPIGRLSSFYRRSFLGNYWSLDPKTALLSEFTPRKIIDINLLSDSRIREVIREILQSSS
jgi:hypothetical protein